MAREMHLVDPSSLSKPTHRKINRCLNKSRWLKEIRIMCPGAFADWP